MAPEGGATKPFHESVVDAIDRASVSDMHALAALITSTTIPKGHDAIVAAWQKKLSAMEWGGDDLGVPAAVLAQKPASSCPKCGALVSASFTGPTCLNCGTDLGVPAVAAAATSLNPPCDKCGAIMDALPNGFGCPDCGHVVTIERETVVSAGGAGLGAIVSAPHEAFAPR